MQVLWCKDRRMVLLAKSMKHLSGYLDNNNKVSAKYVQFNAATVYLFDECIFLKIDNFVQRGLHLRNHNGVEFQLI